MAAMWDHSAIKKHKLFGTAKLNVLGDKGFTRGRGADEKRDDEYARVAEEINKIASAKGMQVRFCCNTLTVVVISHRSSSLCIAGHREGAPEL